MPPSPLNYCPHLFKTPALFTDGIFQLQPLITLLSAKQRDSYQNPASLKIFVSLIK